MYNVSFTSFKLTAKKTAMDKIEGVLDTVQVVFIGMTIANFLLNTGHLSPAIELCKECLSLLDSRALDEIGDAVDYRILGTLHQSVGDYNKAQEYYKKALAITMEIGDRGGEAVNHGNLGTMFQSLGNYKKAQEHYMKALSIRTQIGDRKGEAVVYRNLGTLFQSLGSYNKAQEYYKKALAITLEISDCDDTFSRPTGKLTESSRTEQ